MIKVINTYTVMEFDTVVHLAVTSDKALKAGKAMDAVKAHLRGLGFRVSDMTFDPSSVRSGMVSAYVS